MKTRTSERQLHIDHRGRAYFAYTKKVKVPRYDPPSQRAVRLNRLANRVRSLFGLMRKPLLPKVAMVEEDKIVQLVSVRRQLKKEVMARFNFKGRQFRRWRKANRRDWEAMLDLALAQERNAA